MSSQVDAIGQYNRGRWWVPWNWQQEFKMDCLFSAVLLTPALLCCVANLPPAAPGFAIRHWKSFQLIGSFVKEILEIRGVTCQLD
jgi:hypothetical protein